MNRIIQRSAAMLAIGALSTLAACGGDDDEEVAEAPVTQEVPASATESTGGLISYLQQLTAVTDESVDPIDVSALTLPTSESDDPVVLD